MPLFHDYLPLLFPEKEIPYHFYGKPTGVDADYILQLTKQKRSASIYAYTLITSTFEEVCPTL
jgi:hypothetical protein